MAQTILIIRPGALGDTLLVAPALEELKNKSPVSIQMVGYLNRMYPLFKTGLIDRAWSLDGWLQTPMKVLESTDPGGLQIISFFTHPYRFENKLAIDEYPPFPSPNSPQTIVQYVADCLGCSLPDKPTNPLAGLLESKDEEPLIWIHPGAGSDRKRYPLKDLLVLRERIQEVSGFRVNFILGEAELDIIPHVDNNSFPWVQCNTVEDLVSRFNNGDIYIGNDTGPTHLAAMMGLTTGMLVSHEFNPQWSPWGTKVHLIPPSKHEEWPRLNEIIHTLLGVDG